MARTYTCQNTSRAFSNNSGTFVVSYTFTPMPAQILVLTKFFTPIQALAAFLAPSLLERYIYENLQKAIKMVLKSFVKGQKHGQC